ncbi:kinase-like protein, partial [Thelephora ganbajun]
MIELFHHLLQEQRFDEQGSRFYGAELLVLENLHDLDVVHKDLKPENILLGYTGHIALCDFGLHALNTKDSDMTNTFYGTPEYLAPEILNGQGYNEAIYWWTLGVVLYEVLAGLPPFNDGSSSSVAFTDKMYKETPHNPSIFGDEISPLAPSILTGLLNLDPSQR